MAALWEQNIRKVVPYVAGEQPTDTNIIKLNTIILSIREIIFSFLFLI